MNISDDELDRLFRAAAPVPPDSDSRLGATAIAIREGIIRGTWKPASRASRRRLRWAAVTTAAAAAVVAVLVVVNVLAPSQQAVALAPPPLQYTAAGSVEDVIRDAHVALAASPDVSQSPGTRSVGWGWDAEMATGDVEIVPQVVTFTWAPGEPSTTTIVAGDSYWLDDELPEGVGPSPYEPGELIDRVVTPADEFALPPDALNLSGASPTALTKALVAFGATPESSSGELFAAVTGLMGYWTLSDEQHAVLLDLLVDAGGLTVLGETEDRLGRGVIGIQVSSVIPERVETMFVSIDTGRIVGMESELVKPIGELPLGVITYTMWDAPD
ncbi:hypothetical protein [Microbacterium sp.]|uniref:hypothetical protein n=1 Tax=Microbacterium sp. TaxID=51671 RepID=UPI0035634023